MQTGGTDYENATFTRDLERSKICSHGVDTNSIECEDCFWTMQREDAWLQYQSEVGHDH
jgi:hypothetical protein